MSVASFESRCLWGTAFTDCKSVLALGASLHTAHVTLKVPLLFPLLHSSKTVNQLRANLPTVRVPAVEHLAQYTVCTRCRIRAC